MTRNGHVGMRACSLPPENLATASGYYLLKNNPNAKGEQLYQKKPNILSAGRDMKTPNSVDLGLAEDVYPPCSDCDPCSPASVDAANGTSKHSPSDCSSAFTDEDSGCQVFYLGNALRVGAKHRIGRAYSVSALDSPSVQSFNNKDEFLAAMTEDLADWMSRLYPEIAKDLDPENFFARISDGVLLCHHATELHRLLEREFPTTTQFGERRLEGVHIGGVKPILPTNPPIFQSRSFGAVNLAGGSFWARDNVANFIHWCRAMRLPDCILFETEDLVSRKNLRSVVVCLLELARLGGRVGMEVPEIVYLEKEIDNEITLGGRAFGSDCGTNTLDFPSYDWSGDTHELKSKAMKVSIGTEAEAATLDSAVGIGVSELPLPVKQMNHDNAPTLREKKREELELKHEEALMGKQVAEQEEETKNKKSRYNRPVIDMRSLDEIVREKLAQCTCEQTFPMIRLSEGRYLFGDKSTQIFVRILRSHVMVRVGGGWDTLDHFLLKYDECRKAQQQSSPSTPDKRSHFKKAHSHSTDDGVLNASNTAGLIDAVGKGLEHGPFLGEGNLQVTKKGREVVYTTPEVFYPPPSKCNSASHCSKILKDPGMSKGGGDEMVKEQLSSDSSIDNVFPTQVISQTMGKTVIGETAENCASHDMDPFIALREDQKEGFFGQTKECNNAIVSSTKSSIEDLHSIPIIDQVVGGFDEKVKSSKIDELNLDKTVIKAKPKNNLLPSPYKPGSNSTRRIIPSSSQNYSINRHKATSTQNLAMVGKSTETRLRNFSRSTMSLNEPSSVKCTSKRTTIQPNATAPLNHKRANSISSLEPPSGAALRTRQPVDTPKMTVWERLSVNTTRNPNVPKIVSHSATVLKRQQAPPQQSTMANNRVSSLKRRNSVSTVKMIYQEERPEVSTTSAVSPLTKQESQKTAMLPTGPTPIHRSSVARLPASGSRIPRPAKTLTVSAARSKSVGSSLHTKCDSTT